MAHTIDEVSTCQFTDPLVENIVMISFLSGSKLGKSLVKPADKNSKRYNAKRLAKIPF